MALKKMDYIKVLYQSYLFGNLGRFSSSLVVLVDSKQYIHKLDRKTVVIIFKTKVL